MNVVLWHKIIWEKVFRNQKQLAGSNETAHHYFTFMFRRLVWLEVGCRGDNILLASFNPKMIVFVLAEPLLGKELF